MNNTEVKRAFDLIEIQVTALEIENISLRKEIEETNSFKDDADHAAVKFQHQAFDLGDKLDRIDIKVNTLYDEQKLEIVRKLYNQLTLEQLIDTENAVTVKYKSYRP